MLIGKEFGTQFTDNMFIMEWQEIGPLTQQISITTLTNTHYGLTPDIYNWFAIIK